MEIESVEVRKTSFGHAYGIVIKWSNGDESFVTSAKLNAMRKGAGVLLSNIPGMPRIPRNLESYFLDQQISDILLQLRLDASNYDDFYGDVSIHGGKSLRVQHTQSDIYSEVSDRWGSDTRFVKAILNRTQCAFDVSYVNAHMTVEIWSEIIRSR